MTSPLVLIDIKSGRLCDAPERMRMFKSEPQFNELRSSMTEQLDGERMRQVVEEYFQCDALACMGRERAFVPGRQIRRVSLGVGSVSPELEAMQILRDGSLRRVPLGMVRHLLHRQNDQ